MRGNRTAVAVIVLALVILLVGCRSDPVSSEPEPDAQPARTGAGSDSAAGSPDGWVWTVIGVEDDDVLNVRDGPGPSNDIIGTLEPWETSVPVLQGDGGPLVRTADAGVWAGVGDCHVGVDDCEIGAGWVNRRFLVAQPETLSDEDRRIMAAMVEELLRRVTAPLSGRSADLDDIIAERGLWVGGYGIYGDLATDWQWIDGPEVGSVAGWHADRTFNVGLDDVSATSFECGEDCVRTLAEFADLARFDETLEILIDDIPDENRVGFEDGKLWQAPVDLHRAVLYHPHTTFIDDDGNEQPYLDWKRIHLVFDWSGGAPRVALINVHGHTP